MFDPIIYEIYGVLFSAIQPGEEGRVSDASAEVSVADRVGKSNPQIAQIFTDCSYRLQSMNVPMSSAKKPFINRSVKYACKDTQIFTDCS